MLWERKSLFTVGKQNYFTGYGILLHELPVVAVLFTQNNNNEGTMKNSILHDIYFVNPYSVLYDQS